MGSYEDYMSFVEAMNKEQAEKGSFVQISEKPPTCEDKDIDDF